MRICVVGAGAIGGVIAAAWPRAARGDVGVLARGATLAAHQPGRLARRVRQTGPQWSRSCPRRPTPPNSARRTWSSLAVKAQSLPAAVADIGPLLGPDTAVLSTLNGVPWWFFDGRFGGPCAGRHLDSVDPGGGSPRRSRSAA